MEHTMHLSTPAPAVLPVALIASTDFTTEAEAIRDADDWREAVTALLEFWTALDRCYSSGEVAACFRTHRMDLRFSVTTVGEEIRNRFYNGELPNYDDGFGDAMAPVQHPRWTVGVGRTPADVQVFVYGPDVGTCDTHAFEVDIPRPGTANGAETDGPQTPAPTVTAAPPRVRPVPGNLPSAYVAADGRCYLPRKVVDAYLGAGNISLRQGDALHVTQDGDTATVTADKAPGSAAYNIWATSGKLAFYSQGTAFTSGTKYAVTVTDNGIEVDLSNPL
jgi:hypothetical protein